MADRLLVDTDILIDAGRGVEEANDALDGRLKRAALAVSVVTQLELIVGCRNKREQAGVERFLRRFEIVPLTEPISARAVELMLRYRLSHGLLIADGLIAATALESAMPLWTKNRRDFQFIEALDLEPYR